MNDDTRPDDVPRDPNPAPTEEQPAAPPAGQRQTPPPPGGFASRTAPRAAPASRSRWVIPAAFAAGCLLWPLLGLMVITMLSIAFAGFGSSTSPAYDRGPHIALIRIGGVITAGKSSSSFFGDSVSGSEDIVEQLEKARNNSGAKAVVLRINSPGGSPSGSEEVWNEIQRVRAAGKKVYVSMADVAASGGYYIASPCDRIYANPSTITGSIGVIFTTSDLSGLYEKIGVSPETIKSGKFKDMGSAARPLTAEERALIEGIVMDTYEQFVNAVVKGRKMSRAEVVRIADGRVFTGSQARKAGLVDAIGGLRETILAAALDVGIKKEPKVIEYGGRGVFDALFGSGGERAAVERQLGEEVLERLRPEDGPFHLR